MRAEREKRAVILTSEGTRDAAINTAEGENSRSSRPPKRGSSRLTKPRARPPPFLRSLSDCRRHPAGGRDHSAAGGAEATHLRVAEQYIQRFGELAQKTNTLILPANVSDVASMVALAMKVFRQGEPMKT